MSFHNLEKYFSSFTKAVIKRRELLSKKYKLPVNAVPYTLEEDMYRKAYQRSCENVIGYTKIPLGIVGPLEINNLDRFFPIATTEGALVASLNRGCKLLQDGVTTVVEDVGMTRAPLLSFPDVEEANHFCHWIRDNKETIQHRFSLGSKHCVLLDVDTTMVGRDVHLKFRASTDDAMGMNIITKCSVELVNWLASSFPNMKIMSISGNYCTDKKVSATNLVTGRGKHVVAEAMIPAKRINDQLDCNPQDLVSLHIKKNLVGSALAGALGGFNSQAANVVAGIFVATGQDLGQIGTSSSCFTQLEMIESGILASVTMPSLELGIVGGGTELPSQAAAIKLTQAGSANDLASVVGGAVLAGELSLLGALCKGDLWEAHQKLGRGGSF